MCSAGVKIKKSKFACDGVMQGGRNGKRGLEDVMWGGWSRDRIKKECGGSLPFMVSPTPSVCPLFQQPPEERHFIIFGRRGVCLYVCVRRGEIGWGLVCYNY